VFLKGIAERSLWKGRYWRVWRSMMCNSASRAA
jgi:hypothetical protein